MDTIQGRSKTAVGSNKVGHFLGMKCNLYISKYSVLRVKRPRAKELNSDYQLKGVTLGQVSNSP